MDYIISEQENSYNQAYESYNKKEYAKAIQEFESTISNYSWSSLSEKSYYYKGKSYVQLADLSKEDSLLNISYLEKSISSYKKISMESSIWVKAQFETGLAYYEMKEYDSSFQYHSRVFQDYPNNSKADNALLYLAHRLRKLNLNDSAVILYKNVQEKYPETNAFSEAAYRIAMNHLALAEDTLLDTVVNPAQLPISLEIFNEIKDDSDRWIEGQFQIGYVYYLMDDYDSSFHYHKTLFETYPTHSKADNALLYMGHKYRKTGNLDSALIRYNEVIDLYPSSGAFDNALYWAGDNYYDRDWTINNNKEKAIDLLNQYIEIADTTNDKYSKALKKLEKMGE